MLEPGEGRPLSSFPFPLMASLQSMWVTSEEGRGRRRREVWLAEEEGSQVENLRLRILQASGPETALSSTHSHTPGPCEQ